MDDNINYETYLFISSAKLIIFVNTGSNKKIYEEALIIKKDKKNYLLEKLDYFLNENIFKIEKKLNRFVKKIFLIIDSDEFFPIEISVKKNDYENIINTKSLIPLLHKAKDCCKKTIDDKKIIHMIVNKYQIDNKDYFLLPEGVSCNSFSLDIKFICISNNLIKNLEEVLKKYQVSLGHVVSAKYIENFLTNDQNDELGIFWMTKKIIGGHNPNEVKLIKKPQRNQGFFEKFFNFFN